MSDLAGNRDVGQVQDAKQQDPLEKEAVAAPKAAKHTVIRQDSF